MSTHAAARQRTRDAEFAPRPIWILMTSNPNLAFLNNVKFFITSWVSRPTGLMTEIEGIAETTPEPTTFQGYYNSSQVISFSLMHDDTLYTFFGVISPLEGAGMAGIIIAGDATQLPDGAEDEGSWSAQAPPRDDGDNRSPRKTAATKKRA